MTDEQLMRLRALAEGALPRFNAKLFKDGGPLCDFLAANTPQDIISLVDEVLKLRGEQ